MAKEIENITKMSDEELAKLVEKNREMIQQSRFNNNASDVKSIRAAKRDIARALTVLNSRTSK